MSLPYGLPRPRRNYYGRQRAAKPASLVSGVKFVRRYFRCPTRASPQPSAVGRPSDSSFRNLDRFPDDFMFQFTADEAEALVSQKVIPSRRSLAGTLPLVFTQEGIAMLSSVLSRRRGGISAFPDSDIELSPSTG